MGWAYYNQRQDDFVVRNQAAESRLSLNVNCFYNSYIPFLYCCAYCEKICNMHKIIQTGLVPGAYNMFMDYLQVGLEVGQGCLMEQGAYINDDYGRSVLEVRQTQQNSLALHIDIRL